MMIFIIIIHVLVCLGLIGLILIQRGRGAGLVESLSGVESMFGAKTSAFLTRTTTVLSVIFFFTCLSLALLSVRQSRSLMKVIQPAKATPLPAAEAPVAPAPQAQPQAEIPQAPQPEQK